MKIIRLITLLILVLFSIESFAQTQFKADYHFPGLLKDIDMPKAKAKANISELMLKEIKISGPDIKTWGNPKDVKPQCKKSG